MRVLSLLQPWAQLVVTKHPYADRACKTWETRSWNPERNKHWPQIQREGVLIHASQGWDNRNNNLIQLWPFCEFITMASEMEFGAIIGKVTVGRVWSTEGWIAHANHYEDGAAEHWAEEHAVGDYSPGRFCFELTGFERFKEPIAVKGKLGFWEFDINGL